MQRDRGRFKLDEYFPLDDRDKSALERWGENPDLTRNEGIYEIRLYMKLFYKELTDSQTVDVAIRYNVVPQDFKVLPIQWETTRQP